MGDIGQILGTTLLTVVAGAGVWKLLPAFFSHLSTQVAGNKANEKTIETLQELVASERAGRVAAESELRNFISNWAEMKSKFDVMAGKLDDALKANEKIVKEASEESMRSKRTNAELKLQVEQLTKQVQELTDQLKQVNI